MVHVGALSRSRDAGLQAEVERVLAAALGTTTVTTTVATTTTHETSEDR